MTGELAIQNQWRFSTKPKQEATGWYYYGFRYYMPTTGRWASRDPIEESGGVNLYGFVRNDGVGKIDNKGQAIQLVTFLAGAGVGALIGGVSAAITGGDVVAGIVGGAVTGGVIGVGALPLRREPLEGQSGAQSMVLEVSRIFLMKRNQLQMS